MGFSRYFRCVVVLITIASAKGQSLGGGGTIEGTVTDPTGASVVNAAVSIRNPVSGLERKTQTDASGAFRFSNVPPNTYHVEINASGFALYTEDVVVRTAVPITVQAQLKLAGEQTTVTVEAESSHMLENVPYAHNDVDQRMFSKLAASSPGSSLSDAIVASTPGVAADSNGFFHPLGDHAQTTFSVDGQPISDQQSKQFSTQIPLNALQSMELITGAPSAEYGDKTSLVVNAQTRSGLGQKPFGRLAARYGSFGSLSEETALGLGNAKFGNFLVVNTLRSGRFLDTPEFRPLHAIGNNGTIFDRIDYQPTSMDALHLNLFTARNWFQVPNTFDQPAQDQRQRVLTYNLAPGYQHTFNAHTLLSISAFARQDRVNYYPSADPFADTPATLAQNRHLTNFGTKADLSYAAGRHNLKAGTQLMQTRLRENFSLGITDPEFNAVCVNAAGQPQRLPAVTDPANCRRLGFAPNPDVNAGLVPFDLTRGGGLFRFHGQKDINQYAFFAQDSYTAGGLNLTGGLRVDQYNGLSEASGVEPRAGISYQLPRTGTVFRAAYSRTFETPYNENLVLSSSTGEGGLATNVFGAIASRPIQPGRRNQYNTGFQQSAGKFLLIDADYFWKFTRNAFDFGTLLNTPIQFPISWRKSKIDGFAVRFSMPNLGGIQAFTTLGHTRSRYFGPSNGGLIFNSPLNTGVFRIDHDQAFQQTTHVRYQRGKDGPWIAFTWRYDSGLVAGSVPDLGAALALTAAEQAAIGLFCGGERATLSHPITACSSPDNGATRLRIPRPGTFDPDHNPPRIAPRHLFDLGLGTDNLFRKEHVRTAVRLSITNLTNQAALYNFLSTFSGTHFVTPRAFQGEIALVF